MRIMNVMIALLLLVPLAAAAQDATQESKQDTPQEQTSERTRAVLESLKLPAAAQKAREAGIPEKDVREVIETSREQGVPAGETAGIFEAGAKMKKAGGGENFGATVKECLNKGMRGRELSSAIHAAKGKVPGAAAKDELGDAKKKAADEAAAAAKGGGGGKGGGKGKGGGRGRSKGGSR